MELRLSVNQDINEASIKGGSRISTYLTADMPLVHMILKLFHGMPQCKRGLLASKSIVLSSECVKKEDISNCHVCLFICYATAGVRKSTKMTIANAMLSRSM